MKLMGWSALVDKENITSFKVRLNDEQLWNESHRRFLISEELEWFEQHHEMRTFGRIINHTANSFKLAGAAWVFFTPKKGKKFN
jgi:hypothetical protein